MTNGPQTKTGALQRVTDTPLTLDKIKDTK